MSETNQTIYTAEYFIGLIPGLDPETAQALADRWNKTTPQTMEEVQAGRKWEEEQRLRSAEHWASELADNQPKIIDEEIALLLMGKLGISYEAALAQAVAQREQEEAKFLDIQPSQEDYEREFLRLKGELESSSNR